MLRQLRRQMGLRSRIVMGMFLLSTGAMVVYNIVPRSLGYGGAASLVFENSRVKVEQIGSMPRLGVSYVDKGAVYAGEDHFVFKQSSHSDRFDQLGHFDKDHPSVLQRIKDVVARLRIVRDMRKNYGARNHVVLKSGTILVFYDKIYRSTDGGRNFQAVFGFDQRGELAPFPQAIAVDKKDEVYWGEYNCTQRPHEVRIFRGVDDGASWSVLHTFVAGEIFHVHSIKYDVARDRLWIMTGDRDEESKLMYLEPNREDIVVVGEGDQGWRMVSLIPTQDSLYWCSDNDIGGSRLYRYNIAEEKREVLKPIGKPCYFSTRLVDGTLAFTTTYEPMAPFSKKNNPETSADVWLSRDGKEWHKVYSVPGEVSKREEGDGYPRPTIVLPSGDFSATNLFLTPLFTGSSVDFRTLVFRIHWK